MLELLVLELLVLLELELLALELLELELLELELFIGAVVVSVLELNERRLVIVAD